MEFIEVESKTILNKVPGNSLPFNWTLNPYRGCSHSCSYCAEGSTPILMADGRTKPIAELRVGDLIYGTEFDGKYRRYVPTQVLDHWQTTKPTFRTTLEDGTQLVTSGDHRFLTGRGWKYVTGTEWTSLIQRPHLTLNNKLMGFGHFATPPKETDEYKRGYLCGIVRGDAHLKTYEYPRARGGINRVSQFRLAIIDSEAVDRTAAYLDSFGINTTRFVFSEATDRHKEVVAIRATGLDRISRIEDLVRWPTSPSMSWRKGFLAGIFDAEGGFNSGVLRIFNCDEEIIRWTIECLRHLGFFYVLEEQKGFNKPVKVVRMLGELGEKLRFFLTVDPSITRKRTFDGSAIKNSARLKVASIEPLGVEAPMFDIATGTGDYISDGVVSHNCFARSTHTYMDMNAGKDFETKIVVKVNAPELLRKELRARKWKGESVAMGTATDPYQRAEGKYKLMPRIIETFLEYRNPFSILTKGTLILRDLDVLAEAADLMDVTTAFSIGTLDEDVWRKSEPGTPHPRKRVEAVRKLNEAGIPCGVLVAPILPGISDGKEQLREVISAVVDAGATHVHPILLHLRPVVRDVYMEWLAETYPQLVPRYEDMYRGSYASKADRGALSTRFNDIMRSLPKRARRSSSDHRRRRDPARARAERERLANEQLSLL